MNTSQSSCSASVHLSRWYPPAIVWLCYSCEGMLTWGWHQAERYMTDTITWSLCSMQQCFIIAWIRSLSNILPVRSIRRRVPKYCSDDTCIMIRHWQALSTWSTPWRIIQYRPLPTTWMPLHQEQLMWIIDQQIIYSFRIILLHWSRIHPVNNDISCKDM